MKLNTLKDLYKRGFITKDEYQTHKAKIRRGGSTSPTTKKLGIEGDYIKDPSFSGTPTLKPLRSPTPRPAPPGAWGGSLTPEGIDSLDLMRQDQYKETQDEAENEDPLYSPSYTRYVDRMTKSHQYFGDSKFVLLDPHIMATPALGDLDGDGHAELVVAVSYFFDPEEMGNTATRTAVPDDVDTTKYVAGGVVVFDLSKAATFGKANVPFPGQHGPFDSGLLNGAVRMSVHLDLTTESSKMRAYLYSTPTLVDLNGDGALDIIVGTSVGFIYALDARGETLPGFPVQIGEIQGQVAVEDITGDGKLDLVASDSNGNVVCFDRKGEEQWHRRITGFASQGATIADANGDGKLDVLLGTTTGHVWALQGGDGEPLQGFPFKTGGRIVAPILPVKLGYFPYRSLQLVVPSFDGKLYMFDGDGKCATAIDVGETSYSMVLADDLTGDGRLDLLLSTMSGNVFCFGTRMWDTHGFTVWPSQSRRHGNILSGEWRSISVSEESRKQRDVVGRTFVIEFIIRDQGYRVHDGNAVYKVEVSVGGGAGPQLFNKTYDKPGRYTELVQAPPHRMAATIVVRMTNQHGQASEDSFVLSFNVHFYKMLKWLLVGPFTAMAGVLIWFMNSAAI